MTCSKVWALGQLDEQKRHIGLERQPTPTTVRHMNQHSRNRLAMGMILWADSWKSRLETPAKSSCGLVNAITQESEGYELQKLLQMMVSEREGLNSEACTAEV